MTCYPNKKEGAPPNFRIVFYPNEDGGMETQCVFVKVFVSPIQMKIWECRMHGWKRSPGGKSRVGQNTLRIEIHDDV